MTDTPTPDTPPSAHVATHDARTLLARLSLLLPVFFCILIVLGSLLLMTPYATPHVYDTALNRHVPTGEPITLGEALFTATSAVSLTGLNVRDTARDFTPFGQAVIALLIQLGALSIITLGSLFTFHIGQRLASNIQPNSNDPPDAPPAINTKRLIVLIILSTLAIELIGAALLYPVWQDPAGGALSVSQRAGMSLFHAVSAFSNAGFDLTGQSMLAYRHALLTHAVFLPLIVVGGLGYPVLHNLVHVLRARRAGTKQRPSLHTRLVLSTTAGLYLFGVIVIGAGQLAPHLHDSMRLGVTAHAQDLDALTMADAGGVLADASFMSLASRTAGFNTIPMDELQPASRFGVMALMLVGGSPGSSAGGIKTTVLAILVLSSLATLRQRRTLPAIAQLISENLIRQALALLVGFVLLVVLAILLLSLVEPFSFQSLAFEAISAASNTGLSLGITDSLTRYGRGVILATMLLGRVGPLFLLGRMAFASDHAPRPQDSHEPVGLA